ncbi:MAG TPA: DUF1643 domain-containing protein [Candidatus Limnocylindria bacterium]|nr:DUF1643 domain-containing protein [Candidatus Limnocylindria bacterium]
MIEYTKSTALFSPDRVYRLVLTRWWDERKAPLVVCGLNPSTADAEEDDPTIGREVDFAFRWGYGGFVKVNAFAFRATDPKRMMRAFDPIGRGNDEAIRAAAADRDVLCAWGVDGGYMGRDAAVFEILLGCARSIFCLGLTKGGHPKHPLYLKKTLVPQAYSGPPGFTLNRKREAATV